MTLWSEQGVNWFGFETGEAMVNGLYANYANPRNFSQVGDFATIVYRQQALGFNAVRLPFRHTFQAPPLSDKQAFLGPSMYCWRKQAVSARPTG